MSVETFNARAPGSLQRAMASPHDPECWWSRYDPKTSDVTEKPPLCQCRRSVKVHWAAAFEERGENEPDIGF